MTDIIQDILEKHFDRMTHEEILKGKMPDMDLLAEDVIEHDGFDSYIKKEIESYMQSEEFEKFMDNMKYDCRDAVELKKDPHRYYGVRKSDFI